MRPKIDRSRWEGALEAEDPERVRRRQLLRLLLDGYGGDVPAVARLLRVGRWRLRLWLSARLAVDDDRWPRVQDAYAALPRAVDPGILRKGFPARGHHLNRVRYQEYQLQRPIVAAARHVRLSRRPHGGAPTP